MLYTHDVTGYLSRCNNRGSVIHKKDQSKLKHFEKIVFFRKILHIFLFPVTLCIYINTDYWTEHSSKHKHGKL